MVQHVEYIPFGEVFIEERNNTWNTPYLFNAKELDEETGLYYYGARYYDPKTSLWLSVDPLFEDYPGISVYAYCKNNPTVRIDMDGRADYGVTEKGFIYKLKDQSRSIEGKDRIIKANTENDIKYNDDGILQNKHHITDLNTFANIKKGDGYMYMSIRGNEKAKNIFEFLAENTEVEWGRVSYGTSSNYISTSHSAFDNGIEKLVYNLFIKGQGSSIKEIDHSHPNLSLFNPLPSGFPETKPENKGDREFAKWLYKYYPKEASKILLQVYRTNGQGYIKYDNKKIYYK